MEFKIVHKGIDSLYISYRGKLKDGFLSNLESKKQLARSTDIQDQGQATLALGGHHFEVKDKGAGVFSYVIVDNWFRIQIAGVEKTKIPALYVQISSILLNCLGLDESMRQLRAIVDEMIEGAYEEKISRVDIFIDFMADVGFHDVSVYSWISPARRIHQFWDGNVFTGWSIGQGGDISARLYDKTIEINLSHKEWFKDIWKKQGWQEGQQIMRLEFEINRLVLSQIGVLTISDLMTKINDVWKLCTNDWLRLAVDNGDKNRSRWVTAPVWNEIQQVVFNDGGYKGIKREVDKSRSPNMKTLYINGLGYLLSYAALNGYDELSLRNAAISFVRDAATYLDACILKEGKGNNNFADSIDYVKKKIKLKQKMFNKPEDNSTPF